MHSRLGGWQNWLLTVVFTSSKYLFAAFLALSTAGYLVGLVQGKCVRGNSLELVNFFFWTIVGIWCAMWIIPQNRALGGWVAETLAIAGLGALCLAGILEARRRIQLSQNASQSTLTDDITSKDSERQPA